MDIQFVENGIHLHIHVTEEGDVRLYTLSARLGEEVHGGSARWFRLAELQGLGFDQDDHHGLKHTGTLPGALMRYEGHRDSRNALGRTLDIYQKGAGVRLISHLQFFDGVPVVRSFSEIENIGAKSFGLEYLTSFALTGLGPRDGAGRVWIPHNTWFGECQWKAYSLAEMGYDPVYDFSMKRVSLTGSGTWPCAEHLPMGCYERPEDRWAVAWQIENAGPWHWELSDISQELYLQLSGPSYFEHEFYRECAPGARFESVACAVALVEGGFEEAIQALTRYRRRIRRPNSDNARPSVIFNDYMNCLMADPTTEKELPLIDAAARAGCRYYCIDAGWYADGSWWTGVGDWLPSEKRFPGGLKLLMDRIRDKGMIPGLWLELEVAGIDSPLAKRAPDDWFFQRRGRRVIDHGRYQLDFRNPAVIAHADGVVDRLVGEYGVGYIKMDYNIDVRAGVDRAADSPGDGLLGHARAYLKWLDGVFARYPDLVIENCSSGGMRMEYSLLSRQSIQSVSDQDDYLKMAAIACNCMTAVTPEQAAVWSYPLQAGDAEEAAFNMVNALLLRVHQSGHLAQLSPERFALVEEGLACHMAMVDELKEGVPFWPTGLADMEKEVFCVGVDCGKKKYLAVWRVRGAGETRIPLPGQSARLLYPRALPTRYAFDGQALILALEPGTARVFEVDQ